MTSQLSHVGSKLNSVSHSVVDFLKTVASDDISLSNIDPEAIGINYITKRLIIMRYPSDEEDPFTGRPIDVLSRFLNARHPSRYMLWNLSERQYDYTKFNDQVIEFSFPGFPAPPLDRLFEICNSLFGWLSADLSNVAVLHCQTGTGRSVVVAAAFLAWVGYKTRDPVEALRLVAARIGAPRPSALVIPSQVRTLSYVRRLLRDELPSPAPLILERVILNGIPACEDDGSCRPYIQIFKNGKLVFSSTQPLASAKAPLPLPAAAADSANAGASANNADASATAAETADGTVSASTNSRLRAATAPRGGLQWYSPHDEAALFHVGLPLEGDVLIRVRHVSRDLRRDTILRCSLHTGYLEPGLVRLPVAELDAACADPRFPKTFTLDLILRAAVAAGPGATATEENEAFWKHMIHRHRKVNRARARAAAEANAAAAAAFAAENGGGGAAAGGAAGAAAAAAEDAAAVAEGVTAVNASVSVAPDFKKLFSAAVDDDDDDEDEGVASKASGAGAARAGAKPAPAASAPAAAAGSNVNASASVGAGGKGKSKKPLSFHFLDDDEEGENEDDDDDEEDSGDKKKAAAGSGPVPAGVRVARGGTKAEDDATGKVNIHLTQSDSDESDGDFFTKINKSDATPAAAPAAVAKKDDVSAAAAPAPAAPAPAAAVAVAAAATATAAANSSADKSDFDEFDLISVPPAAKPAEAKPAEAEAKPSAADAAAASALFDLMTSSSIPALTAAPPAAAAPAPAPAAAKPAAAATKPAASTSLGSDFDDLDAMMAEMGIATTKPAAAATAPNAAAAKAASPKTAEADPMDDIDAFLSSAAAPAAAPAAAAAAKPSAKVSGIDTTTTDLSELEAMLGLVPSSPRDLP